MAVSAVKKEAVKPAAKSAAEADVVAPLPKKRTFNWKLPVIALCVLGAAGGGAYWYSTRHHADSAKEVKAEPAKPPQFLPLDPFTVNLQLEDNPQYLQVGLTLKVSDNAVVDAVKLHMPEVRDSVLLLLSSQKSSTLLTLDGKRKLATGIVAAINAILAPAAAPAETPAKAAAPAPAEGDNKPADVDAKPAAEADDDAKPAAEADAKPAAETGDAPAAAATPPVLNVLFTSFIVQ
jgi:flagellar FliL protein